MRKILILPSWYPSFENSVSGIFFYNQIRLFINNYDVRILFGVPKVNSKRFKKLLNTIIFILFGEVFIRVKHNFFHTPPYIFGFEYEMGLNKLKRQNYKLRKKAYLKFFKNEVIINWQPDLIHSFNFNIGGIIAKELFEEYGFPYINTEHHPFNFKLPPYFYKDLKQALKHSKYNFFVSQWQYRTFLLFDKSIEGEILGNPVDGHFFKLRVRNNKETFKIIHISNGDIPKDLKTLFKTIEYIYSTLNSNTGIEITILGFSGTLENLLRTEYGQLSWYKMIRFLRPGSRDIVRRELQRSDVFIFTSVSESFGIAPLEALMCGVPVVATDNGAIHEYLKDGVNGILCRMKDYKALAEAVLKIYKGEVVYSPEKVRQTVFPQFHIDNYRTTISGVYDSVININ